MTLIQSKIILKKILEYSLVGRDFDSLVYFINHVLQLVCWNWSHLLPEVTKLKVFQIDEVYKLKVILFWIFNRSFKCKFTFSFFFLGLNTSSLINQIRNKQFNTLLKLESDYKNSNSSNIHTISSIVLRNIGTLSLISPYIDRLDCNLEDDTYVLVVEYLKNLFESTIKSNGLIALDRLDISVFKIHERNPFIQLLPILDNQSNKINTLVYRFDHELDFNINSATTEQDPSELYRVDEQPSKRLNGFLQLHVKKLKLLQSNRSQKAVCHVHNIVKLLDLSTPLTYLYLERITISHQSLIALIVANQSITTLKLLDMDIYDLQDKTKSIDPIIDILSNDKIIQHLSISMRRSVVDVFSKLLFKNSGLKSLQLLSLVGDTSLPTQPQPNMHLLDAYGVKSKLESITINSFNTSIAKPLLFTQVLDSLDYLDIHQRDNCSFSQTIIPVLQDHRCHIRRLTLTNNDAHQDWDKLFGVIKQQETITHLTLIPSDSIPITSYTTLLTNNRVLKTLDLLYTRYGNQIELDPLLHSITSNTCLENLKIEQIHCSESKNFDFLIKIIGCHTHNLQNLIFNCVLSFDPPLDSKTSLLKALESKSKTLKSIQSYILPPYLANLILSHYK